MKKLLMLQGIPGSGKTTYALDLMRRELDAGREWVRVNRDDIRRQLEVEEGWQWSHANEHIVENIRDGRILDALAAGKSVVSDDTNFSRKAKTRLAELARRGGATFTSHLMDTPVDECVRRDSLRTGKAHVGEAVVRGYWRKYRAPQTITVAPYVPNLDKPRAIIVDLDGTLALKGDRSPYDASTCDEDTLNEPVAQVVRSMDIYGFSIVYLSGREEKFRPQTMNFLLNNGMPPGPLYMRTTGDYRKDWVIKGELFDAHIRPHWNVTLALDDRQQVVDFWRSIGLTCLQVAPGNF